MCHTRNSIVILTSLVLVAGIGLWSVPAHAVPALQLYLEGATYDSGTDTWAVNGGTTDGTVNLWVLGDVGGKGPIYDVHLVAAFDSDYYDTYHPEITLTPLAVPSDMETYLGFDDATQALDPGAGELHRGEIPLLDDGTPLPTHGIYGTGTDWVKFNLGDFTSTDSQMIDLTTGWSGAFARNYGQINVYSVSVTGDSALPEDFTLHFDAFDHYLVNNGDNTKYVFAPFSHDAEGTPVAPPPPVPEPLSMVMLGCLGAGMLGARKARQWRNKQA